MTDKDPQSNFMLEWAQGMHRQTPPWKGGTPAEKAESDFFQGLSERTETQVPEACEKESGTPAEEAESDFFRNFKERMKNQVLRTCEKCGEEFKGQPETDLCTSCSFLEKYPEFQPKRWTWAKVGREWGVSAIWPDNEREDPLPEPGETVTVHRRDGATSEVMLREYDQTRYTPSGERKLFFRIFQ